MEPALRDGDLALAAKRRRSLVRGRIVVVRAAADAGNGGAAFRVKRVVGLPGERVEFRDGALFINGVHFPEAYLGGLPANAGLRADSWTLGADEYFLMGDNRAHSDDSRRFGPAREADVVGTVFARVRLPRFLRRALSRRR